MVLTTLWINSTPDPKAKRLHLQSELWVTGRNRSNDNCVRPTQCFSFELCWSRFSSGREERGDSWKMGRARLRLSWTLSCTQANILVAGDTSLPFRKKEKAGPHDFFMCWNVERAIAFGLGFSCTLRTQSITVIKTPKGLNLPFSSPTVSPLNNHKADAKIT